MGSGSGSTVESLRGRLLAERQASRVANEEADLLDNKLRELEKKLTEENKMRGKAEKKLKFLMKKLQSLDNTPSSLTAQALYYYPISESSSLSTVTTTSSSIPNDPGGEEEEAESKLHNRIPEIPSLAASGECSSDSEEKAYSAPIPRHCENTDDDDEHNNDELEGRDGSVDNSRALVPVPAAVSMGAAVTKSSSENELKMGEKEVGEVLEALRHAREKIEMSMGGRRRSRMITVAPICGHSLIDYE